MIQDMCFEFIDDHATKSLNSSIVIIDNFRYVNFMLHE